MSDMIERVARVIVDHCDCYSDTVARAVIKAMREPDKAMIDKGIDAIEDATDTGRSSDGPIVYTESSDYALPCWRGMIDAALGKTA